LEAEALEVEVRETDAVRGVGRVLAVMRRDGLCEPLEALRDLRALGHAPRSVARVARFLARVRSVPVPRRARGSGPLVAAARCARGSRFDRPRAPARSTAV